MSSRVRIPRLRREGAEDRRIRTRRACDLCRQRRTKCDGKKPICSQCQDEVSASCVYLEGKIEMERKALASARKKLELYEDLLRDLSTGVGDKHAERISKALESSFPPTPHHAPRRLSTSSSAGSLDAIDTVDQNVNRDKGSRATGYFGKSFDVAGMQKLEAGSRNCSHDDWSAVDIPHHQLLSEDFSSTVSYHTDKLNLPGSTVPDAFVLPDKFQADELLNAYLDRVHPSLPLIRRELFLEQYEQAFSYSGINPGKQWLGIMNMVLTIGCRLKNLYNSDNAAHAVEMMFFSRARALSASDDLLYSPDDLHQVQFLVLMAFYFLTKSQISRSWKIIGIAARAGVALGLNIRSTHQKFDRASNEARVRLWSVFYLEHLLSAMTGRDSCLGSDSCSVPLPLPFDDIAIKHPNNDSSRDHVSTEYALSWMNPGQSVDRPAWLKTMPISESLYLFHLVDLAFITHQITNQVYSAEVVHRGWTLIEGHIRLYNSRLGQWLSELPDSLVFNRGQASMSSSQISLALHFYSACIITNLPCLTRPRVDVTNNIHFPRSRFGNDIALECLRASLSLIAVMPDRLDTDWANSIAPSWTLLHFMIQATIALLLHLSIGLESVISVNAEASSMVGNSLNSSVSPAIALVATKKALEWLDVLGEHGDSSRKGFEFCNRCFRRIAQKQGLDISGLPDQNGRGESPLLGPLRGTHTTTNIEPGSFTLLDPEFSMADFLLRPDVAALEELLLSMIGSNA